MYRDQWLRFSWDLKKLPEYPYSLENNLKIVEGYETEFEKVWEAVDRAYSTDSGWNIGVTRQLEELQPILRKGMAEKRHVNIALVHGPRIIGLSILDPKAEQRPQFVSGVCVLNEYRSRSLGSVLLYQSLKFLADNGLEQAAAYSKDKLTASKYLYPKFGGKSESVDERILEDPKVRK